MLPLEKRPRRDPSPGARGLPPGVSVRAWRLSDFPAVQRLARAEGWGTPIERPTEALRAWRRSWPALVATEGDAVIGFLRAVSDGAVTTYVAELLVASSHRGAGLGTALLAACRRAAPGARIDLLADESRRGYYHRQGFRSFLGFRKSWAVDEE